MKRIYKLTFGLLIGMACFSSCTKIEQDPYKRVEGKWIIKSTSLGGINAGENGSYLQFNACDGMNCNGVDYNGSDTTSGTFEYSISESSSSTLFFFTDTTSEGGFYNGEYEATLFNNSTLNLEATSILGTLRIEMKKE